MITDVMFKCSSINGGNYVSLGSVSLTYRWSNFIMVPEHPSRFLTADAQSTVDFLGWSNPLATIRGIMDLNNVPSDTINIDLLKQFAKEKLNPVYIKDNTIFPVDTKIKIKSFSLSKAKNNDAQEGRIDFQIEIVETL